jgi:hypothetical protein
MLVTMLLGIEAVAAVGVHVTVVAPFEVARR